MTVDGSLISRCEIFDEADLDAALTRFDELQLQVPRVKNAATRVEQRFNCASQPAIGPPWRNYYLTTF